MEQPTKANSLYLTIKQVYFDQIVAGTKKEEYREVKDTTYKKYLECDENGYPYFNVDIVGENPEFLDIMMWCDGHFPFFAKESIKYLDLAVGYAKERDTCKVEVTDITLFCDLSIESRR